MDVVAAGVTQIGKYRLLRELGRGGMGVVYLAEDTRLERLVALKVLHPFLSMDAEFARRFTSEARAIAALAHKGIVRIHAFEEVAGSHLIDMEYIEGGALDRHLGNGHLSPVHGLGIAIRVFEALAACHERGIIHRDIKPSNILMASDGRVLLSDFGLARSCDLTSASTATTSTFIGTPKYAAPESWGKHLATPAGDVYSAGLVLLELLAGRTPYDGDSPLEIMRKVITGPFPSARHYLPGASDALTDLIDAMLDPDPNGRPVDAGEALARLRKTPEFAMLPEDSTDTIRVTPVRMTPVEHGRSKRRSISAAVLLAGLATVIGAAAYNFQRLESPSAPMPEGEKPTVETRFPKPTEAPAPEISPAPTFVSPEVNNVFAVEGKLVFAAVVNGWRSLWSHDLSTNATAPLWPELAMAPEDDIHGVFPVVGGVVAVIRSDVHGYTLFKTDGTTDGTLSLAYAANRFSNRILSLGSFDGKVYFNRIGGDRTYGLWETDGTIEGTRHIWGGEDNMYATALGFTPTGDIFFSNHNKAAMYHLPRGASEPTLLTPPWNWASYADRMIVLGDRVLFEGSDGVVSNMGRELWVADTARGSARLLYDFMPENGQGLVEVVFGRYKDRAVFAAMTPGHGRELWISDSQAVGVTLLCDVNPGPEGSNPMRFVEAGGLLYFNAWNREYGEELWVSDGTEAGSRLVHDIAPGWRNASPHSLTPFKDGLLFTAFTPQFGEEIWLTDGTSTGTRLLLDCMPGSGGRGDFGTVVLGERAYFSATHPQFGRVLWESDGSPEGTRPLFESLAPATRVETEPAAWYPDLNRTFLTMTTPDIGAELWSANSRTGETTLVRDIRPGPKSSNPRNFVHLGYDLFFVADDGAHGEELWSSSGISEHTWITIDVWEGKESSKPRDIIVSGEKRISFIAFNGTETGIYSVIPGTSTHEYAGKPKNFHGDWNPAELRLGFDGWLYFSNKTPTGETTIWRTQGTEVERVPGLGLSR